MLEAGKVYKHVYSKDVSMLVTCNLCVFDTYSTFEVLWWNDIYKVFCISTPDMVSILHKDFDNWKEQK